MTDETPECQCSCHASSGSHRTCNIDAGFGLGCGPHADEICILGHPALTPRFIGFVCKRHYHWIDRTLNEIVELFALLPDVLIPGPGGDGRSKAIDAPVPGRLAVMALTDRRAKTPIDLEDPDDIPDAPGTLHSWARIVAEERHTDEPDGTLTGAVRLLRRERHWVARQPWVDDFVNELTLLHAAVARGVGTTKWPEPIGKCPNCGAPLHVTIGVDAITCRRCKSAWEGVAYLRLRLILEKQKRSTA